MNDWPLKKKDALLPTTKGLFPNEELNILVNSLLNRHTLEKPVVLPILSDVNFRIDEKNERVKIIEKIELFDESDLKLGDIILVKCPKLATDEFNTVVKNADLFIAEGANSISFAKKEGIPFLIGGRQYLDSKHEGATKMEDNQSYQNASKALCSAFTPASDSMEKRTTDVHMFINDCLDKKYDYFYDQYSKEFKTRPDKVFASLMAILLQKQGIKV